MLINGSTPEQEKQVGMTIYWLTGVIGSGKSTLGAALASHLPQTIFIDGDFLLPNIDAYDFEQRIKMAKGLLREKCRKCAEDNQSAVIAYPIEKAETKQLKKELSDIGMEFILIGITNPPASSGTRGYTDWEVNRQKQMEDLNGAGYADILFEHPTQYLHDSVLTLLKKIEICKEDLS